MCVLKLRAIKNGLQRICCNIPVSPAYEGKKGLVGNGKNTIFDFET